MWKGTCLAGYSHYIQKVMLYSIWSPLHATKQLAPFSKTGHNISLPWVTEIRYLGIHFVQSRKLKCSLDAAKRGFYRAANSIFSKIGRTASEEVISSKCMPILMYGLETLFLQKNQLNSLDCVTNRLFIKLFRTTDIELSLYVKNCLTLNCRVFSLKAVVNKIRE